MVSHSGLLTIMERAARKAGADIRENTKVTAASRTTEGFVVETATGVTLGALKAAVAAGQIGPHARVVRLVTGDGLKTPGPVSDTYDPIMIEADADAFLHDVLIA